MLSPKNKRILFQLIPFGLIASILSIVYSFLEKGILGDHPIYPSTGNPYTYKLLVPATFSFLIGIGIGFIEIVFIRNWFQESGFAKKIIFKTLFYLVVISVAITSIVIFSESVVFKVSPWNEKVLNEAYIFVTSFAFWSILIYFACGVIVCLFYAEVSDNIGHAVLLNFLTGKYHQPIEEERAFMFLDMKSSTTIAEELGHVQYFKMLKEYYADLTEPIIKHGGEIYMYIGDEVIISWKLNKGFAENCLSCYFAMKATLEQQAKKYNSKYGLVPTFKAGIHLGEVTTGEIGVIKKDITFSGDVLNTTSRIQGLCNTYHVDLLTSEKFINNLESTSIFQPKSLGETELRGRNEKINLYTLEELK